MQRTASYHTTYDYNAQTNVLEWVEAPNDDETTRTEYTYDNMYRMASAAVTTDTGLELSARYTYTDDLLTQIRTESTTYGFTYGDFGLRSSVKAGNYTLASYQYTPLGLLQRLDYGNNDSVSCVYDEQDRLTTETYEDGAYVKYEYDNDGGLAKVTDSETGITATYYYDFIDRLCHYTEKAEGYSLVMKYGFNTMDAVSFIEEIIDGNRRSTTITYDDDQRVDSIRKGTVKESYTYDAYSRVVSKATTQSDVPRLNEQIVYRIPDTGITSGQVSSLTVSAAADGGYSNTFSYSYDANGNITDVISGGSITTYTYDTQNQLIREDNQAAGKSWTWTYDNAGNILSRTEYAFTTGTLGTALDTVSYVYSTGTWGDRLITYDGAGITYDNVGNPLTFGDRTLTWKHGRELASLTEDGTTWTYSYNADGLRIGRTNGTTKYQYIYADGQLVKQRIGTSAMGFSYDANGTPMSVYYAGAEYYYVTNLQGDVVAILDYSGAAVVTYTYDAWGKLLTTGGAMATTLGKYNPLRYRGYVYDRETELYYVSSRYYDPEIGRWISPEPNVYTGGFDESAGLLGHNVYAYCANNPVIYKDETGEGITLACVLIFGGIGLLAGGGFGAYRANKKGLSPSDGWKFWKYVVGYGVVGGAVGALVGWGASALITQYGVTSAATSITKGGGVRFNTFKALKDSLGSPGIGKQWHHIVEQCQAKATRAGFNKYWIQNSNNVINISESVHTKISAFYSSIPNPSVVNTHGMVFRDWLSGMSFKQQYKWGVWVLRYFGVKV